MKTITEKKYTRRQVLLPAPAAPAVVKSESFFQKVAAFIERQSVAERHFGWVGGTMIAQSIVITPLTAIVILSTGNWTPLWFVATASMYATFIPSLAGLSTGKIIGVFLGNLVATALIIAVALLHG